MTKWADFVVSAIKKGSGLANISHVQIHEDLENYEKAFKNLSEGNYIQKKLLKYNIEIDIKLFNQVKLSFQKIKKNTLKIQAH